MYPVTHRYEIEPEKVVFHDAVDKDLVYCRNVS
jgi:hypothetical protein